MKSVKGKIVLAVVLSLFLVPASSHAFDKELGLDHFKFYKSPERTHEYKIGLRGQFDKMVMDHVIRGLIYFGAAVDKNGEGILDKNAHLNMYMIEPLKTSSEPARVVVGKNQFGAFKMVIDQPVAMLAPTWKLESGHEFPKELDHFKCYRVRSCDGQSLPKSVVLQDQFDKEPVRAQFGWPHLFCTPVIKYRDGKPEEDKLGKGHLFIYRFQPIYSPYPSAVVTKDQFRNYKVSKFYAVMLAVPTHKIEWKPLQ